MHRYSIGWSLSHAQSQCLEGNRRRKEKSLHFLPVSLEWSIAVGPLSYYKQNHSCKKKKKRKEKKKPFAEVIESPTSVLIGPSPGVKGHSAMTNEAVRGRPQSSSFLLPTFSWSRPLRLRMKPVKPSSCGGSRQIHHFTTGSHL